MTFADEVLEASNKCRLKHGCPPLVLDNEISAVSQKFAEKLFKSKKFEHSPDDTYGENIFMFNSSEKGAKPGGNMPVNQWYDEIKFYSFDKEPKDLKAGHFTQLIWKETKKMGVGIAGENGNYIVVCNYYPPGNMMGEFKKNIPPASKTGTKK